MTEPCSVEFDSRKPFNLSFKILSDDEKTTVSDISTTNTIYNNLNSFSSNLSNTL